MILLRMINMMMLGKRRLKGLQHWIHILLILGILGSRTNISHADDTVCGGLGSLYCNCDDVKEVTDVTCYSLDRTIPSDADVWKKFSAQQSIVRLKISAYQNIGLDNFPIEIFRALKDSLRDVRLSDLNFTRLPSRAFYQMSKLQILEISLCPTMVIEENAFEDLPSLEKIMMNTNNIPILPKMFKNLPKLRELFIEDNRIETFADDTFVPLQRLSYLTLDKNLIEKIEKKNFKGLSRLDNLDIRLNRIKILPNRVFEHMPNLEVLDLSYNRIELIEEQAFYGLRKLQELKLEFNNLRYMGTQLRNLPNLVSVNLESNRLNAISKLSFHRPGQKRYVFFKITNNTLYCDCHLYWLREAFDSFADRNYEKQLTSECHNSFSDFNNKTVYQFLNDPLTEEKCVIPEPPKDDIPTTPVETINTVETTPEIEEEIEEKMEITERKYHETSTQTTDGATSQTKELTQKPSERPKYNPLPFPDPQETDDKDKDTDTDEPNQINRAVIFNPDPSQGSGVWSLKPSIQYSIMMMISLQFCLLYNIIIVFVQ